MEIKKCPFCKGVIEKYETLSKDNKKLIANICSCCFAIFDIKEVESEVENE